ncbi:MAG: hypothetical protein A2V77_10900 [Anaeromyxobacter sp. RBG_16_69_14]|nr:MAG: hypothetical protein A2V77_10900 [Anaeromyxobacter sp. RBG_16_69_14]
MNIRLSCLALALCACGIIHQRAEDQGPVSRPAGDEGMLMFTVGRLSFEAPAAWEARGDARHVLLVSPRDDARLDAKLTDRAFKDDRECLAHADEALSRGSSKLTNVRRHPTTFAGRKALVQEADQGGWHGWAWAVCDGGEQYRIFFTGRSPLDEEAVRASRLIPSSALLTTRPGA